MVGCATTTETVFVGPECDVPPRPVLPEIASERMDDLSDETYWDLMDRERRLTDWGLEMEAMLDALCTGEAP